MSLQVNRPRRAFTLVELLVVIAIIGILVALLLPAIQAAREAARRTQCKNNLKNLGLSCLNFENTRKAFPTGGITWGVFIEDYIEPKPPAAGGKPVNFEKLGLGWGYQILPYLEEGAMHGIVTAAALRKVAVSMFICPSRRGVTINPDPNNQSVLSDYSGFHPCTRILSTDAAPMNLNSLTYDGTNGVRTNFYKPNTPDIRQGTGATTGSPPGRDGVYDGVIVRSSWRRNLSQPSETLIDMTLVPGNPAPTKISKIIDGTSKTLLIGEKYTRPDFYSGGTPSDDTGMTDGWDPDIMRCTCLPPLNDGDVNPPFTGRIGDNPGTDGIWEQFSAGSAHTGGFNVVFADGSVHTISYDIATYVFNSLGTRNGTSQGVNGTTDPETTEMTGVN